MRLKVKKKLNVKKVNLLFSNKSLTKNELSVYHKIVYVPITVSDKVVWANSFKQSTKNKKNKVFNWMMRQAFKKSTKKNTIIKSHKKSHKKNQTLPLKGRRKWCKKKYTLIYKQFKYLFNRKKVFIWNSLDKLLKKWKAYGKFLIGYLVINYKNLAGLFKSKQKALDVDCPFSRRVGNLVPITYTGSTEDVKWGYNLKKILLNGIPINNLDVAVKNLDTLSYACENIFRDVLYYKRYLSRKKKKKFFLMSIKKLIVVFIKLKTNFNKLIFVFQPTIYWRFLWQTRLRWRLRIVPKKKTIRILEFIINQCQ